MDLLQEDFVALLEICAAKGNEAHLLHVLDIMQETIYKCVANVLLMCC